MWWECQLKYCRVTMMLMSELRPLLRHVTWHFIVSCHSSRYTSDCSHDRTQHTQTGWKIVPQNASIICPRNASTFEGKVFMDSFSWTKCIVPWPRTWKPEYLRHFWLCKRFGASMMFLLTSSPEQKGREISDTNMGFYTMAFRPPVFHPGSVGYGAWAVLQPWHFGIQTFRPSEYTMVVPCCTCAVLERISSLQCQVWYWPVIFHILFTVPGLTVACNISYPLYCARFDSGM